MHEVALRVPQPLAKSHDDLRDVTDFEFLDRPLFLAQWRIETDCIGRLPHADWNRNDCRARLKCLAAPSRDFDRCATPFHVGDFRAEMKCGARWIESGAQPLDQRVIAVGDPILLWRVLFLIRRAQRSGADAVGVRRVVALDEIRGQLLRPRRKILLPLPG